MNLLFLDQFSDLGGAQRVLLDTVATACRRGWRTWAALPPSGPLIDQLRAFGTSVAEIPCGPYRSGTKSIRDALRFRSDVQEQTRIIGELQKYVSFDLIYVNGPRLLPAVAAVLRGRTPVLFHAHSHVQQALARKLAARSVRRVKATVVACSNSVMEQHREYVPASRQFIIPNGVAEIPFRERSFPRDGAWRIGVIGRISPEKGQADFVRAAALLSADFPRARFIVCGAPLFAESSYFNRVQQLAHGLPIELLGWREDIGCVLADLDLLVVPSKQEGMGRVIIEAFSAGVPVAAFAVGGIPEVVSDRETGFLVHDLTAAGLAGSIRDVMRSDAAVLAQIAIRARQRWETRYTLELYQTKITDLMERVASGGLTEPETAVRLRHK